VVTVRPIRVPTRVIPASARSPPPTGSIVSTARTLEADGPCCCGPLKPCTCTWCGCLRSTIADGKATSRRLVCAAKTKIWDVDKQRQEVRKRSTWGGGVLKRSGKCNMATR
jgi:hypothetical protein